MVANVLFINLIVRIRSPKKSPRLKLRCKSPNLCKGMLNSALTVNSLNKNPSDDPSRCIRRTTTDCRGCRSFLSGCRFGRSGSSGFVGGFLRLCWSSYVPVPRVRAYRSHPTSGLEVSYWLRIASDYYKFYICTEFNCLFAVLFLKILFYISVLLLRTFN